MKLVSSSSSSNTVIILFLLFLTFSLINPSKQSQPSIIPPSILNACDALANSGRLSMSLTLQLIAPDLNLPSPISLTVFAPPDSAFIKNGQPSWAQLFFHLSPITVSSSLFHFSNTLPCLTPKKHLDITSNTVNGVNITQSPIFDDGLVVVYGIDTFLDLDFVPNTASVVTNPDFFKCLQINKESIFAKPVGILESRGHSIMASFLRSQLLGYYSREDYVLLTVFAPMDEDVERFSGNFLDYGPILKRHVLACKVDWTDVSSSGNGTMITNCEGDVFQFTKDEDSGMVMVNGVEITAPDMYETDWLVVHGIRGLIPLPVVEMDSSIGPSL